MKKMKLFAYVGALAMLSGVMLTSCNREVDGEQTNREMVKTEFAIALPSQLSGQKRMPSTSVQKSGASEFQGINGITLIPFAGSAAIESGDTRLGDANISLTDPVAAEEIAKPSHAKSYGDVQVPLSTASFLFYGKSAKTGEKAAIGSLIPNIDAANTSSYTFDLEQIVATDDVASLTGASAAGGKLLAYLNSVASAADGGDPSKKWYEYGASDDAFMASMFATFSTMKGLSSFEVARVMTDLYKSFSPISSDIATAVVAAIDNDTYAEWDGTKVVLKPGLDEFPQSYGIPEGSISIKWDGDPTFKFVVGDYAGMATPDKYTYPAQLWYYANSAIRTANSSRKSVYDATNDWDDVLDAHDGATAVNTRTRAIVLTSIVNYAVARLDVTVKVSGATLADNSGTVTGVAKAVAVPVAGYPVTAVLVGGQKQVGFDFAPKAGATTEYTIYDHELTETMHAENGAFRGTNSTLVLASTASEVRVAVEMVNDGEDFYGADGIVPAGGKFYVVGSLSAAAATETDRQVFKQDYTTTAKLTLTNLQSAYNTIPDLRTPQLEIGFSVDLTWSDGHTYEVNFE